MCGGWCHLDSRDWAAPQQPGPSPAQCDTYTGQRAEITDTTHTDQSDYSRIYLASMIFCDVCQFAGCWLLWVIHRQSVADADDTGWVYTASSSSESLTPTLTWCLINESQVKMMGWECCCPIQQLVSFRASFRRHCVCDSSCIFTAAVCSIGWPVTNAHSVVSDQDRAAEAQLIWDHWYARADNSEQLCLYRDSSLPYISVNKSCIRVLLWHVWLIDCVE